MTAVHAVPPWDPFPLDRSWLSADLWEGSLRLLRPDAPASDMLAALGRAFSDNWVHGLASAGDGIPKHPLPGYFVMAPARFTLLELGLALHELRPPAATLKRLRDPEQFLATSSELWAGMLLRHSGARLAAGCAKTGGPDWIAEWSPDARVAAEVKRPRESQAGGRGMRGAHEFLTMLGRGLDPVSPPRRLAVTVWPSAAIVRAATVSRLDTDVLHRLAEATALAVHELIAAGVESGVHMLGGELGSAELVPIEGPPGVQVGCQGIFYDGAYEGARLAAIVEEAAKQIESANIDGLVILDLRGSPTCGAGVGHIASVMNLQPTWADRLGAVLVIGSVWDSRSLMPHVICHLLRGPRFEALPAQLRATITCGGMDTTHFEPLRDPRERNLCEGALR